MEVFSGLRLIPGNVVHLLCQIYNHLLVVLSGGHLWASKLNVSVLVQRLYYSHRSVPYGHGHLRRFSRLAGDNVTHAHSVSTALGITRARFPFPASASFLYLSLQFSIYTSLSLSLSLSHTHTHTHNKMASATKNYTGSCHCGAFEFHLVDVPVIDSATTCNCSICVRKGYAWTFIPSKDAFKVVKGQGELKEYTFGKKKLVHQVCLSNNAVLLDTSLSSRRIVGFGYRGALRDFLQPRR